MIHIANNQGKKSFGESLEEYRHEWLEGKLSTCFQESSYYDGIIKKYTFHKR